MKDALGDRMKDFYEDRTRFKLARRTNTIIRIDGKAFHTYTKGLTRPFDSGLIDDMNNTTAYLCKNIQGVKFGYVQSDEISLLLTDYDTQDTDSWFDSNLQKMCSVAASMATSEFNRLRLMRFMEDSMIVLEPEDLKKFKMAEFDARVFQIPSSIEVENYFIWRQQDATRNSISSVAQSLYSPRELNGVKTDQMQELIFQKGINWNDYSYREKRGTIITKVPETNTREDKNGEQITFTRNKWKEVETPIFSQERDFLRNLFIFDEK
jgi:tRNA(His) 5'-end guanylyltransferase